MKKKILTMLMAGMMVMSFASCGASDDKQDSGADNSANTSADTSTDSSEQTSDEQQGEVDEDMMTTVAGFYYDLQQGVFTHQDFYDCVVVGMGVPLEEVLQAVEEDITGIGFESVETVEEFQVALEAEQGGTVAGSVVDDGKVYEASAEIQASELLDPVMQVGDAVLTLPITVGDFLEQTGGVVVSKEEACENDSKINYYMHQGISENVFASSTELAEYGITFVRTQDGSYFAVDFSCHEEPDKLQKICDQDVDQFVTGSDNVFWAGNLHGGMTMEEIDAVVNASDVTPWFVGDWHGTDDGMVYRLIYNADTDYDNYNGNHYPIMMGADSTTQEFCYFQYDLHHFELD